jgi:hypothetical protein
MADCISWPAAQEVPEKRLQAATCQQSFVKLGLNDKANSVVDREASALGIVVILARLFRVSPRR